MYEVTFVGLWLLGIGTAALLVASFSGAQKSALESISVTPDEIYALIAGIWTSAFALGNFIGPTLGGFLVDYIGFRNATTVFQVKIKAVLLTKKIFLKISLMKIENIPDWLYDSISFGPCESLLFPC